MKRTGAQGSSCQGERVGLSEIGNGRPGTGRCGSAFSLPSPRPSSGAGQLGSIQAGASSAAAGRKFPERATGLPAPLLLRQRTTPGAADRRGRTREALPGALPARRVDWQRLDSDGQARALETDGQQPIWPGPAQRISACKGGDGGLRARLWRGGGLAPLRSPPPALPLPNLRRPPERGAVFLPAPERSARGVAAAKAG